MGNKVSMSRTNNRSQYTVHHKPNHGPHRVLWPGQDNHFNDDFNYLKVTLSVYDSRGRRIKYLEYWSGNDNEWEIFNGGVRLMKQWDHSGAVGTGWVVHWGEDKEAFYAAEDRREEERRRQEEERRRQEEERRRQEEERRRQEEAERQRQSNVDQQRTAEIEAERYNQDLAESAYLTAEIGHQLEKRMMEQTMEQQRTIGWSTADKIEIKGKMEEISMEEVESEEHGGLVEADKERIWAVLRLIKRIDKAEDKSAATLATLEQLSLRAADLEMFPDKLVMSLYKHLLALPREALPKDNAKIMDVLVVLLKEVGLDEPMISHQVVIQLLEKLPPLPTTPDLGGETTVLSRVTTALNSLHSDLCSFPPDTFTFYVESLFPFRSVPEELLEVVTGIIKTQPRLISPNLVDWAVEVGLRNERMMSVILEQSDVRRKGLLKYLETFPSHLSPSQTISHLAKHVDEGFPFDLALLPKYLQFLKDNGMEGMTHELLLLVDAVLLVGQVEQKKELESVLSHKLGANMSGNKDLPLILRFAGSWYLQDKIDFVEPLFAGMMVLLKDEAYVRPVSGFFENVAEKNVKNLDKIVINPEQLENGRGGGELLLKTKLAILDARLKAGIKVPEGVIDKVLSYFHPESPTTDDDLESIYYRLQIAAGVVAPKGTVSPLALWSRCLLPFLDHTEPNIRIVAWAVLRKLVESGQIHGDEMIHYFRVGTSAFQNWDSVASHQDAAAFVKRVVENMSSVENNEHWETFSKNIIQLCAPALTCGSREVLRGCLEVFQAWIDKAMGNGLLDDKYLEDNCATTLPPRLLQKLLLHLLSIDGHSLHGTCVRKLAENAKLLERLDKTELEDLSRFLNNAEVEGTLKEDLVVNVLAPKLDQCQSILPAIESLVECGKPAVVRGYVEGVSRLSMKVPLNEETIQKLLDILEEPRFKMSVQKGVAKCLFYILRLEKSMLERSSKLGTALLRILRDAGVRVFGLFALCHVPTLPDAIKEEVLEELDRVHEQFLKMRKAASALHEFSHEQELTLKLSRFLLTRFGLLDNPDDDLQLNWMSEWLSFTREDDISHLFSDQRKQANWLLRQDHDPVPLQQGRKLAIEMGIIKANFLLDSGKISEAESVVDKSLQLGMMSTRTLQVLKADVFMAKSSFKGAIRLLRKVGVGAKNEEICLKLSHAYMALGQYDKADKWIPRRNVMEREVFKRSKEFRDMLVAKTGSVAESRSQMKAFHAKTSRPALVPREKVKLLEFMTGQGVHFDLSVLRAVEPDSWKVELIARELFSRSSAAKAVGKDWKKFYFEFLELQNVYSSSQQLSATLSGMLTLARCTKREVPFGLIMEMLFLLKTVHLHEDDVTVEKFIAKAKTLDEVANHLRNVWITGKFAPQSLITKELKAFFNSYDCAKELHPDFGLPFLDVFLNLTKVSNPLASITDFIVFIRAESIPFAKVQELLGQLRLSQGKEEQGSGRGIRLKDYQEDFLRERLITEILQILDGAHLREDEQTGLALAEMMGLYEDKIYGAEEIKDFLLFITGLEVEKRTETIKKFLTALSIDKAYKNVDIRPKIIKLVKKSSDWKEDIRSICMGELLEGANEEKDLETLVTEFKAINNSNSRQFSANLAALGGFVKSVNEALGGVSVLGIHTGVPICSWDAGKVGGWAVAMRASLKTSAGPVSSSEVECFAVIQHAMKMFKGYQLRQVGLMSLRLLLSSKNSGCLAKIATGEGKSGLVAALAVYKCLHGHTVDVITNSSVLAQRDCSEWSGYFALFGLTAEENSGLQAEPHQPKECYLKNIVYGDTSAFQGDVLRHEFSLLGTRGSRAFDTVVVDEVDSMFIDGSNHSTRLIDKMPQMDYVEPLFSAIWQLVGAISSTIVGLEGLSYAINSSVTGKLGELTGVVAAALAVEKIPLEVDCSVGGGSDLEKKLAEFVGKMEEEELADSKFRRQVVALLRQKETWSLLPKKVEEEVRGMELKELLPSSGIVDNYIRAKWEFRSDSVVLRNVLQLYLKINILVYENVDNSLQLSTSFHSGDSEEENSKVPTLRFFRGGDALYFLTFVESEPLYVSRAVEKAIREQVCTSVRTQPYKPSSGNAPPPSPADTKISFPGHLYKLYNTKIDEWIQSAIQAMFSMEQNRNYVIKPGSGMNGEADTITPVDFENTGVTQESSVWGDGLHQFLQMKHKLRITPEYLATNFISNMSFFQRYSTSIYGLTGTLGDSNEVDLLKSLYTVETINVPTFKPKRLLELDSVMAPDESGWKNEILNSASWEVGAGRVVLIICRTIEDVNLIKDYLEGSLQAAVGLETPIDYRLYYRSDDAESEGKIGGKLSGGTVVIATNLAGRGTNIKLADEVVAAGGLHVIITFLPTNVRVEEQAVGRCARNGEPGTSQLILNLENETSFIPPGGFGEELTIGGLKEERGRLEKGRVDKIRDKLASELKIEEEQFVKFCQVKQFIQRDRPVEKNKPDYILKGVGERWAVELEIAKTRNDVVDWAKVDNDFNSFFENLRNEYRSNVAIHNPSYYILQANLHLFDGQHDKAIEMYSKAIDRDRIFVQHAFYNRAHAIINQAKDGYKEKAMADLAEAANLINGHIIPSLCAMHGMVEGKELRRSTPPSNNSGETKEGEGEGNGEGKEEEGSTTFKAAKEDTDFTKQMVQKINFNYLQVKSIQEALDKISNSKRDVVAKFGDIKEFYARNDTEINYADIEEMEDNGFIRFMYVEEKPFPWWEVFAVFILGAVQMVVGVCLCLIGAVNVGAGLVAEGASDIVAGITACVTGEFSWKEYLQNKALSLGVSLLCAGAGVALKAVAALPKVAAVITAVKNAVMASRAVAVGTAVWTGIKTAAKFVWGGIKAGGKAAWGGIKYGAKALWGGAKWAASKISKVVMNSGPMQYISKTRPWIYAKNVLSKVCSAVKDGAKYVWNKIKSGYNWAFGTQNVSPETCSNFRAASNIVARQIINSALSAGFEHSVLKALKDAVEKRVREDVEAHLKLLLGPTTEHGKGARKVFSSCMGKKADVGIANEMRGRVEGTETPFGERLYKSLVPKAVTGFFKLLKEEDNIIKQKPKGWAALGAHLVAHVSSLVMSSITIGETIKELVEILPLLENDLAEVLKDAQEKIDSHDHAVYCHSRNDPVDPKDVERILAKYASDWAATLAKRMSGLIMSNLVQPRIDMSFEALRDKFTKAEDFEEFLTSKARIRNDRYLATRPGAVKYFRFFQLPFNDHMRKIEPSPKPAMPKGDDDIPSPEEDFDVPKPKRSSSKQDKPQMPRGDSDIPSPEGEESPRKSTTKPVIPSGDTDIPPPPPEVEDILRFSSKQLDKAIDLFIESEQGLRYQQTFGGDQQNKGGVPLRIVSKTSSDGLTSFSRLTSGNSSGELELMEFAVGKAGEERASLYAALSTDSSSKFNFESRKTFEEKLVDFSSMSKPRSILSFAAHIS